MFESAEIGHKLKKSEFRREEPKLRQRLRDVLKSRKNVIDYLYDFGDSWEHRITVTNIRPGESGVSYPRYIAGEWNAPPEDCGGIPGFYALLEAVADPRGLVVGGGHPAAGAREDGGLSADARARAAERRRNGFLHCHP